MHELLALHACCHQITSYSVVHVANGRTVVSVLLDVKCSTSSQAGLYLCKKSPMSSRLQLQVTGSSHVSCRRRCRMQRVGRMVRAWKQWCLFKHYQQVAAGALRRKHLAHHALQCWRLEWLPRATAKQQLAQQQAYKVSILHCSGLCKNKEGPQRIQSYQLYNNLAGYTATKHASHHVHADYLPVSVHLSLCLSPPVLV